MDLYSMIEAGGRMKFEITGEDLVIFAEKLITKAQEMKEAEMALAPVEETYLSTDETCAMCKVSKTTLWSWEKIGYLVPSHVGKKKCYALSVVQKLLSGSNGNLKTSKKHCAV